MSIDPTAAEAVAPSTPAVGGATTASDFLPAWAAEIAELFSARASCLFVVHGNVHDIVRQDDEPARYGSVP